MFQLLSTQRQLRSQSPPTLLFLLLALLQLTALLVPPASVQTSAGPPTPPPPSPPLLTPCSQLQPGQFLCSEPDIDPLTQQAANCSHLGLTTVQCELAASLNCDSAYPCPLSAAVDSPTTGLQCFNRSVGCSWTNGKQFHVAVLLSVFTGFLGLDRFYLGYPAIGLVKLFTFGGYGFLHLLDVILISLQIVRPADHSHYVSPLYGPLTSPVSASNSTLVLASLTGSS